jgi:hypothetical protein
MDQPHMITEATNSTTEMRLAPIFVVFFGF